MQHLCETLEGGDVSATCTRMSNLGEVVVLRRIKPHAPLLVRAPVNSFEF